MCCNNHNNDNEKHQCYWQIIGEVTNEYVLFCEFCGTTTLLNKINVQNYLFNKENKNE